MTALTWLALKHSSSSQKSLGGSIHLASEDLDGREPSGRGLPRVPRSVPRRSAIAQFSPSPCQQRLPPTQFPEDPFVIADPAFRRTVRAKERCLPTAGSMEGHSESWKRTRDPLDAGAVQMQLPLRPANWLDAGAFHPLRSSVPSAVEGSLSAVSGADDLFLAVRGRGERCTPAVRLSSASSTCGSTTGSRIARRNCHGRGSTTGCLSS